jgi:prephenate dehydrogenase
MLGQVTVIGCGLIGGSLVKALRARKAAARLCAVDASTVLDVARTYLDDAAETGSTQATGLVATSDLVILAMPISAIVGNLEWVLAAIPNDAVVTDTGSVKEPIVAAARSNPRGSRFVGGHPMAGREVGGFEASTADLFEKARWFLIEDGAGHKRGSDRSPLERAIALAESVGAEPSTIGADAHDRAMAYVSHAPQLIASAIYSVASRAGVLGEAGPGFRDVTRISGAPASPWRDIFDTNRRELAVALAEIIEPLVELERLLQTDDRSAVDSAVALLERAQRAKREFTLRSKGEPTS